MPCLSRPARPPLINKHNLVKLLSREKNRCVFLIGKREREMMCNLLRMYPMLSAGYQKPTKDPKLKADAELLREALAEQHRANKEALEEMLKSKGRFVEDQMGYRFSLKTSELEWLLQVFNDVRVGSWVKLGSPSPQNPFGAKLTEENVQLAWAMEMAGLFEHSILEALHSR